MRSILTLVSLMMACWLFIGNLSAQAAEPKLEKVVLQLKWLHQFQFAGYYAAQKQGYFAEQGLDVEIRPRNLQKNNIDQVLNGEADYGISDSILMLYQAKGEPVVFVAPIFQHSPQALITLKSSGLDSPYKLENAKTAFYPKDTDGFSILAMGSHIGVDLGLDRIRIKTDPGMLVRGEVDAYAGYLTNEAYYFYKQGIDINIIRPMNYGIDLYGDILFTSKQEVEKHPQRVEGMRRAVIKGWQYALAHKKEMAQYILDTYQPKNKTLDHLLFEANAIEDMMDIHSTPIGTMDEGRLQFTQQLFKKHQLIQTDWDLSEGIYKPQTSKLSFTQAELEWIEAHPVLKLGIDPEWYPIDFVNEAGHFSGISSELFRYIEQKTGIRFEVNTEYSWSQTMQLAKQRKIDLLSALTITEDREKFLEFTSPYLRFPTVIATRSGTPYLSNLKALNQMKVAVVENYAAQEFLEKNFSKAQLLLVNSPQAGLEAVSKGEVDGYVDNVAVIGHHIQKSGLGNIQIGGELPYSKSVSIGVRNDWPQLKNILDKVLAQLHPEELSNMQNRYLKVSYQKSYQWTTILSIVLPLIGVVLVILLLYLRLAKAQKALQEQNEILETLSTTDHLTGIYNRSYTDKTLASEVARAQRYRSPLSVLLFDLDFFKEVNDTYGHDVGDEVLIALTLEVKKIIRQNDVFGRWGGEEFLVVCPGTNEEEVYLFAQKLHASLKEVSFPSNITQTVSIGVAQFKMGESVNQLLKRVDLALYQAKSQGRNCTVKSEN